MAIQLIGMFHQLAYHTSKKILHRTLAQLEHLKVLIAETTNI